MSDKSIGQNDAQAKSDDEISSSNYSRSNHLIQQSPPKNILTTNPPNDILRRRAENDEPWTLPFASPGFPQFQMPLGFQQMTNLPAFSLTKMDNLFEEFSDNHQQMDQRWQSNPFQKVLGPMDMIPTHDQVNQEDNINVNFSSQGTQNQQIKSQAPSIQQQQQYTQNLQQQQQLLRFPYQMQQQMQQQIQQQMQQQLQQQMQQQQQNPMIKNSPQPFQNLMYNQQMLPQQLQQYKQYQQQYMPQVHPQPFVNNQYIPNQREQESQQYQNNNAVSKELLTKVYMIVQHTSVSSFQCNCKKSKCLKLYCECFANGQVCSQSCNCLDCKNRIDNPQERQKAIEEALTRNNDAFNNILNVKNQGQYPLGQQASQIAPQLNSIELPSQFNSSKNLNFLVSQIKGDKPPQGKGSLQNRLRRGCNCKKSNCKKKYCECFSAGLSCNDLCKCDNCYNKKGLTTSEQEKNNPQDLKQISNDYLKDIKEEGRDLQMVEGEEQQIYSSKKINFKSKKIKKEEIEQSGSDNKIQIKKDIWNKPKKSQQLAQ